MELGKILMSQDTASADNGKGTASKPEHTLAAEHRDRKGTTTARPCHGCSNGHGLVCLAQAESQAVISGRRGQESRDQSAVGVGVRLRQKARQ